MSVQDPEIVNEFVVESSEHLATIECQLLDIEANGENVDVDLVNKVFRGVHSMKGAAGFLGFDSVQALAHSFENVLNLMREGSLVPDSATVDVMLRAADLLRTMVDDIENSNDVDGSELVEALNAITKGNADSKPAATPADSPEATSPPDSDTVDVPPEKATETPAEETASAPVPPPVAAKKPAPTPPPTSEQPAAKAASAAKPAAKESTSRSQPTESNIRVSVDLLDNLMNLAGEMVLGRNQLMQTVQSEDATALEAVTTRLDHITSELQEAIMKTRMQPIGNVFNRFSRVVRDLSNKLGKQCNLQIEGKEVEVDKTIVEAIGDPLTHLVRNSIDHGIEMPADREASGKPAAGSLKLHAYHQSGKVKIAITDDGKGIDPGILRDKAVSKGLISQERADAMSDREAVRLIFHPGFSTAAKVTDVSGRGVGMDVVRSNIEALGGTVDIETQVNRGTTIVVTLPLTLAIIPSLIVESSGRRFAMPQVNIVELVRVGDRELQSRIGQFKNKEVLRLRGSLLPLVRLEDALDVPPVDDEVTTISERNIIVVESGSLCYGIVVDDLFDSEEIVVKPLGRHLKDCPCLSGATILGDGQVALILDVSGIAQQSGLRNSESDQRSGDVHESSERGSDSTQSVLLFTNDPKEQFAILMEAVTRIERVRADQIDSIGGRELLQYGGGTINLLSLENLLSAAPRPEQERYYVVIFEAAGQEMGLIAPELIDIRAVPVEFDQATFDEMGIIGSFVTQERTTRLIDTVELARRIRPDWFTERDTIDLTPSGESDGAASKPTLLLAEDSTFFRRQVKTFLEEGGFDVVGCEDGRDAWNALTAEPSRYQLVLTDIEMPNMNGLELARKIRSENRFATLPIVALTSLASQEDSQRGYDAGVSEYHIKLDRVELLTAVQRLTGRDVLVGA